MSDAGLKPCPFCGARPYVGGRSGRVYCPDCDSDENEHGLRVMLIDEDGWNRRPVEDDLRARLAAAQSARGAAVGRADRLEEECAALRVAAAEYNDTLARLTAAEGRADRLRDLLVDAVKLFREYVNGDAARCWPNGSCKHCWGCRGRAFLARYEREGAADE